MSHQDQSRPIVFAVGDRYWLIAPFSGDPHWGPRPSARLPWEGEVTQIFAKGEYGGWLRPLPEHRTGGDQSAAIDLRPERHTPGHDFLAYRTRAEARHAYLTWLHAEANCQLAAYNGFVGRLDRLSEEWADTLGESEVTA